MNSSPPRVTAADLGQMILLRSPDLLAQTEPGRIGDGLGQMFPLRSPDLLVQTEHDGWDDAGDP